MKTMAVICTLYGYAGGTGRVTTEIIERYAKDGNAVDVYCAKYDDARMENSKVRSVTVVPITSIGILTHWHLMFKVKKALKCKNYDIIYSAGALYPKADIVTVHMMDKHSRQTISRLEKEKVVARRDSRLKCFLRGIYAPLIYESLESIVYHSKKPLFICVSEGTRREFLKRYDAPKTMTIPNGVDAALMKRDGAARERLREQYGLTDGQKAFLFVGSEWVRKRLDMAILAVSRLPQSRLFILGLDANQAEYAQLAKSHNCEERVTFVGFSREVEKYFSMADYMLFPSVFETFGLVALEGMAAGLVVFSSRLSGTEDYIKDGENGFLFKPGDQMGLDEKIDWIFKNPQAEDGIRKKAVETAEAMQWDAVYERYKRVFDGFKRA